MGVIAYTHPGKTEVSLAPSSESDSIHGALESLLRAHEGENLRVRLGPGVYKVSRPLVIGSDPKGKERSLEFIGNGSTISGGIEVKAWRRTTNATSFDVIDGKGSIWEADVPSVLNTSDIGSRVQLWKGRSRLTLARSAELYYEKCSKTSITYKQGDIGDSYHDMGSILLVLYNRWTATYNRIASIDRSSRTINLTSGGFTPSDSDGGGSRYYISNAREHLDQPGEFYIDRIRGKISIFVAGGEDPNDDGDSYVVAAPLELLRVEGSLDAPARDVSFENIDFAYTRAESPAILSGASGQSAEFLEHAMVNVAHASFVRISSCTFRHTGGYAFQTGEGTHHVAILDSFATDLGAGGVRLGTEMPTRNATDYVVSGNVLEDGGHVWQMGCGILAQKVSNVQISHNEVSHFRYTGVSIGWDWGYMPTVVQNITISNNHIHHIGLGYLSDMGCIYTLGHIPKSIIHHNLCTDVQSYGYGGWGYYTDEGSRDLTFESNLAVRTKCAGQFQHYGTDNLVRNNIYYNVDIGDIPTPGRKSIFMPGRCDGAIRSGQASRDIDTCSPHSHPQAPKCCCYPGCNQAMCSSMNFTTNIVMRHGAVNTSSLVATVWAQGLDNFTFEKNIYFQPDLPDGGSRVPLFNDTKSKTWNPPQNAGHTFADWQAHGKDTTSKIADPKFVSASQQNFTLDSSSPAFQMGFKQIDLSKCGPQHQRGFIGARHASVESFSVQTRKHFGGSSWAKTLREMGLLMF